MYFFRFLFFALIFKIAEVEDPGRRFKPDSESNLSEKKFILERKNKGRSKEGEKLEYYGDYSDSTSSESDDSEYDVDFRSAIPKPLKIGNISKNEEFSNFFSRNNKTFKDRIIEFNKKQALKKETTPYNKDNWKKKNEQFDKEEIIEQNLKDLDKSEGTLKNDNINSKVNVSSRKTKPKWKPESFRKQTYGERKKNLTDEKTVEKVYLNPKEPQISNEPMKEAILNKKKQDKGVPSSIEYLSTPILNSKIQFDKGDNIEQDYKDVEKSEGTHENDKNNSISNISSQKTKPKGPLKWKPESIQKQSYEEWKKKLTDEKTVKQVNLNAKEPRILNEPMKEAILNKKKQDKDVLSSIKNSSSPILKSKIQFDEAEKKEQNSKDVEKSEGTHENDKNNSISNISSQKTKPKGQSKWKPELIRKPTYEEWKKKLTDGKTVEKITLNNQEPQILNEPMKEATSNRNKQEKVVSSSTKNPSSPISNTKKKHETFYKKAKNSHEDKEENSNKNKRVGQERKTINGNARKVSSKEETSYIDEESKDISENSNSQQSTEYDLNSYNSEGYDTENKSEEVDRYGDDEVDFKNNLTKENLQESDDESKLFEPKSFINRESKDNGQHSKISSTCDNSWSYIDEPIRFSEDNYPNWTETLQFKTSKIKGAKILGSIKPCGTLSQCVHSRKIIMSPWFPLLLKKGPLVGNYTSIRCGVTLISRSHAITASKCVLKANTGPLYLIFGNFNFADKDHDGLLRKVETIALIGEDMELAVLIFEELIFFNHVKPICLKAFDASEERHKNMKTVAWNWASESVDASDEIVTDDYCGTIKRIDKRNATLTAALICPRAENSSTSFCMRTKTTSGIRKMRSLVSH
ncbi:homeobox protein 13-like isoform X2 [Harmonia axyridis]|uniref:homeobox protein 13-like isoform X2 n=1 Tax=Harmonia axyridis TaxID=115357 RepID=UPI001E275EF7|nr:homeobox protein 13-like isoform X2 [Harmonia axyridis]